MKTATHEALPERPEPMRAKQKSHAVREDEAARRQPRYAVVLHNDDVNGFLFVVGVLCKVFGFNAAKAYQLTLEAHQGGRSLVWSGSLEVAELKADQVRSCGADPDTTAAIPLRVTVEPLPG